MSQTPEELDLIIKHFRSKYPQESHERIGGWDHIFKSDYCLAADYLEQLRSELPNWQITDSKVESREP